MPSEAAPTDPVPLIVADGATWLQRQAGAIVTPGRIVKAGETTTTDIYCGRGNRRYGYSETFVANGSISSAMIAVHYGYDKMIATYDAANACLEETFYYTAADPFEQTPQTWTGIRRIWPRPPDCARLHPTTPISLAWRCTMPASREKPSRCCGERSSDIPPSPASSAP